MYSQPHLIPLHPQCGVFCTASDSYENIPYPHHHAACELSLIVKGVHTVELEGETIELSEGDVILLRANVPHSRRMLIPGRYLTLAFEEEELHRLRDFLDAELPQNMRWIRFHLNTGEAEKLARDIDRFNFFCTVSPTRVKPELRALLAEYWRRYFISPEADRSESIPWLKRLTEEMKKPENIRRGLDALLGFAPYTHAYLCREFRRLLDCTPTEYVNSLRLDYAHHLLENTHMEVADICYEVGFESVSYFYQLFRSKYAVPPARYRKMRFVSNPSVPEEQLEGTARKKNRPILTPSRRIFSEKSLTAIDRKTI